MVLTARSFPSALAGLGADHPDAILLDETYSIVDGLRSVDLIKRPAMVVLVNFDSADLAALVGSVVRTLRGEQANQAGTSNS